MKETNDEYKPSQRRRGFKSLRLPFPCGEFIL